jgi:hypothetical protein
MSIIKAAASFIAGAIGLADRQAPASPQMAIEKAEIMSAIGGRIFESDAARQKAESQFFNDGTAPVTSKYMTGEHGTRLPFFRMAPHLLK